MERGSAVDLMSSGVPLWSAGTARSLKITIVTTGSTMTVHDGAWPSIADKSTQPVSYAPCMRDHMDLLVLCVIVATLDSCRIWLHFESIHVHVRKEGW